ncbi:dynein regulatory complex protein 1 [Hyla sarda]|uniref:dynein regulatory complex protein 1 n=1 Tax=Hyla sarda TaxID=327740 RepID=UPI0024C41383|nr:dynein regulatory complex protein 1 [Hyla sarda]XP_056418966.1 dynein regulatory complex protein 1 [Hyla sarda]
MSGVSAAMEGEETSGPSLDSEDQQERIRARRQRIAARIEAKRREALGEDPGAIMERKETPRRSYKQMDDSRQRLNKLVDDGTQLVTNIQVAADGRERHRRAEEEELRRLRVETIDNEARSSSEKFDEITKKWLLSGERRIPQELWSVLNTQQQQCGQLIEDKNHLIGALQQELKRKDDQYVKDLKKQSEDINLLIERMEEQVRSLSKTYRQELLQIEKTFEQERRELLNKDQKKWEQSVQRRRDMELESLMNRMRRVEEYEQQLNQLRVQDGEEYNIIKIKLETDVQILQQQLQQMKATYQLNQEKLEYNYQVLKKRDEENTITKSQQKRKITRLQDVLNNLKIKLEKQIKQYREENQALSDDLKRIAEQYKELQKKLRHFAAVDAKKFHDIWVMNEEEMKQLVQKALEVDRIIHEQQLGLPWKAPDLWFMDNIGPLVVKPKEQKSAGALAQEVIRGSGGSRNMATPDDQEHSDPSSRLLSLGTVKQILEVLCDESGFLIEKKLEQLLSPLEKDERSLIQLDAIFGALHIEVEDDVYRLVEFFLKHKQQQQERPPQDEEESEGSDDAHLHPPHSTDLIHPNDVLGALRAFTMELHHHREKPHLRQSGPEERDSSEDATYWKAAAQVIPQSRLTVWEALESAMEKYYDVLTGRSQLITETLSLRQQNTELRMMLHQYLNSQINAELEIPPTRTLQVDTA